MTDLDTPKLQALLNRVAAFKSGRDETQFRGKTLALLFEKPSLRTRTSFEVAIRRLGGHSIYYGPQEIGLGQRESVRDVVLVLSRFVDAIAARTFVHSTVTEMARYATIPIVNALTDLEHPCQAVADLQTLAERQGGVAGKNVAYIGDGNNCAISLLYGCALLGAHYRIASPEGYELPAEVTERAWVLCAASGGSLTLLRDPLQAAAGADALYTDVWTSMGQEAERAERVRVFADYQINQAALRAAKPGATILHPLPAHHGEEIAEGILYLDQSAVFDQAENRLWAQMAVLATLFEDRQA
ncbi:MAG: ornithine carbamoyltransferase [Dehalococcoidia bacterium]|nr:ornithine carbamoyltransferase [Dehalococcoidia bacterium]